MNTDMDSRVKRANAEFFNRIADVYEDIDGRRGGELSSWLDSTLRSLKEMTPGDTLLDMGCGTGIVLRQASRHFGRVYGMDVSAGILSYAKQASTGLFCAEGCRIPLKDESVDVIICFAVLHHVYDHGPLLNDVYRVLKKGGVLYIDHDLDRSFSERFSIPLKIYRFFSEALKRRKMAARGVTEELYNLAEVHSDGVDSVSMLKQLESAGFSHTVPTYHWFGLNGLINKVMKHRKFKRGFAPLFSVIARK